MKLNGKRCIKSALKATALAVAAVILATSFGVAPNAIGQDRQRGQGRGGQGGQNRQWNGQGGQGRGGQGGQNRQWNGQGGQGRGGQGGQNRQWNGQGGQGRGGQSGPGGRGGFDPQRFIESMNRETFDRIRNSPFAAQARERVGAELWAKWESGDFSSTASAADQAAAAAEGRPLDSNMTEEERNEAEALLTSGTVPDFSDSGRPYSIESENEYYQTALAHRDETLTPNLPIAIRYYGSFFMRKYDKNGDHVLQRSEWEDVVQGAQAVDLDGDWNLTEDEISYYLARFAKDRTIANPNPKKLNLRPNVVVVENKEIPVLIRTASAPPRAATSEELAQERDETLQGDLADLDQDEFKEMLTEDNPALESVDDPELLDALLYDMDDSVGREYTPAREREIGVPVWFLARDRNGDGQLTLLEFAPNLSNAAVAQFGRIDLDRDGVVTPDEVRQFTANSAQKSE